ncbi:MAG: hypothetical protein JWO73_686 [Candidatus Taylorbacteria bacterium]|nr:hypothetical protein [Candidatus Taylorbacteria bacterium]
MDHTYRNLFSHFGRFFRPYRGRLIAGTAVRIIAALLWMYTTYAIASLVTFVAKYHPGDSLMPVYHIFGFWLAAMLIRYTCIFYSKRFCIIAGEELALDVEEGAVNHLALLDIAWHERENAGSKVKRIQRGADGLSTYTRVWVVNIIDIAVNFIGTFIIISHFDLMLAILIVLYEITYFILTTYFKKRTVAVSKEKNIKDEEVTGLMYEVVNNVRSVKVLGMSLPLIGRIKELNAELACLIRENQFWYHMGMYARTSWEAVARIAFLAFVVWGILHGRYELGFLILFNGYFQNLTSSINDLSSVAQDIALAKTSVGRLADIFSEPIVIDDEKGKADFPKDWKSVEVRNLSFSYGHGEVLSGIKLRVQKGEKVGIVGLSGAGKSTLFKLLLKEYESGTDDILIGDMPLRHIKKSEYVRHVAAVLQDTEVFNMTLRKNVELANSAVADAEAAMGSDDAFQKAIDISHVRDFLHKLPAGVESLIGEKGVKLSGGERQRLGIARAVYKNPEILFLDEATSHLDVESEQKIQDSLAHFFKDVTAVVIAHRLSTIKEMDRIVVMEGGKIIEDGTFESLHASGGRFREFWDKQRL